MRKGKRWISGLLAILLIMQCCNNIDLKLLQNAYADTIRPGENFSNTAKDSSYNPLKDKSINADSKNVTKTSKSTKANTEILKTVKTPSKIKSYEPSFEQSISSLNKLTAFDSSSPASIKVMGNTADAAADDSPVNTQPATTTSAIIIPTNIKVKATDTTMAVSWDSTGESYDILFDNNITNTVNSSYIFNSLKPNTQHTLKIRTVNGVGKSEWSEDITRYTLLTAPDNIVVTTSSGISVDLAWDAVPGATGYRVYRDAIKIGNSVINSYSDNEPVAGVSHVYRIEAYNATGNVSAMSRAVTALIEVNSQVLSAPQNIKVKTTSTTLAISCDPVEKAESYDISLDSNTINVELPNYTYNGLEPNTKHTVRIRTVNSEGCSAWSPEILCSTLLASPVNLVATPSAISVYLEWKAVDGATGYEVYRNDVKVGAASVNMYTDSELNGNTVYTYRIKAFNAEGNVSDFSDALCIRTKPLSVSIPENYEETFETDITYSTRWRKSDVKAFEGKYSLRSSGVSDFSFSVSVKSLSFLSFKYLVSTEAGYDWFRFYVDDKLIISDSGVKEWWQTYTYNLTEGNHKIRFEYTKDGSGNSGYDSIFVDNIKIFNLSLSRALKPATMELADSSVETFENKVSCFKYSGNWVRTDKQYYEGNCSIRSNEIGPGGSTEFSIDLFCIDKSFIQFKYLISSESGYDWFRLYIDGEVKLQDSGEKGWRNFTYNLAQGKHIIRFAYSKDGSVVSGYDAVFVDQLEFYGSIIKVSKPIEAVKTYIDIDNTNTWTDTYLADNLILQDHTINIKACDIANNESEQSSINVTGVINIPVINKPIVTIQPTSSESFESEKSIIKTIRNDWVRTNSQFTNGAWSLRSNPSLGNGGSSEFTFDVYCVDDTFFNFKYMVSSEAGCDFFRFYMDGSAKVAESGSVPWKYFTTDIPAGRHTFSFVYSKDGSVVRGEDSAFIDEIELNGMFFNIIPAFEAVKTQIRAGENSEWQDAAYNGLVKRDDKIYIKSQDIAGNWSQETTLSIKPGPPPSAPTSLKATAKSFTTVTLLWKASDSDATGYYVYRDGKQVLHTSETSIVDTTGLLPGKAYSYEVKAFNSRGAVSESSNIISVTTNADSEAPSIPTGLRLSSTTSSSVTILWDASTDNVRVKEYGIFRDGVKIGVSGTLAYTDSNLSIGKYSYYVTAYDLSGNESGNSNAITFDNEPPAIPLNLKAISTSATQVTITWDESTDNIGIKGYEIFRNSSKVGQTDKNTYNDTGLAPDTIYTYTVKAYDAAGNISAESNSIQISTVVDTQAPTIPQNLAVASRSGKSITLSWSASSDNVSVTGYEIYRGETKVGTSKVNSYKDAGLTANTAYNYSVIAYDAAGNKSGQSSEISASTVLPEIVLVQPSDAVTIGGPVKKAFYVYFKNSGNMNGSSAKFEYSADGATWLTVNGTVNGPYLSTDRIYFYTDWDLSKLKSGSYFVRYSVYDESADSDSILVKYQVDNDGPDAPKQLSAQPGLTEVSLSWTDSSSSDVSCYRVYRKIAGQTAVRILDNVKATSVKDNSVSVDTRYIYQVSAVDILGNESILSDEADVLTLKDTVAPVISGVQPGEGSRLRGKILISAFVTDNVKVADVEMLYSKIVNNKKTWLSIGKGTTAVCWDTAGNIADGVYEIKVSAKDTSGNCAEFVTKYTIDNTPPDAPVLKASASELKITLTWQPVKAYEDFDHYMVYRGTDASKPETFSLLTRTAENVYIDTTAPINADSVYKITTVDKSGNESQPSNVEKARPGSDITPPVIDMLEPADGSAIRGTVKITVHASDNMQIKTYSVSYRMLDENNNPIAGKEWAELTSADASGNNNTTISWNTALTNTEYKPLYPDGNYQIKVAAIDIFGNQSEKIRSYAVTNNPPSAPDKIWVSAGEWELVVGWSPVIRPDFSHYVLYRKEGRDGAWEKIISNTTSNIYIDKMRDPAKEYYYCVAVVNDVGRESVPSRDYSTDIQISDDIKTHALQETSSPVILSLKPSELARTNSSFQLEASVSDNVSIYMRYEYAYIGTDPSAKLTGKETWQLIGEDKSTVFIAQNSDALIEELIEKGELPKDYSYEGKFTSKYNWDTAALAAGVYAIRAAAVNKGNKESILIKKVIIDREAPYPATGLTATDPKIGGELHLSWNASISQDVERYDVYRAETSGEGFVLVSSSKTQVFRDTGLVNGKLYFYIIKAVDIAGNVSKISNQVSEAPSAVSDLAVTEIKFNPEIPAYEREAQLNAEVKNLGYAKATGKVKYYILNSQNEWEEIGSVNTALAGSSAATVSLKYMIPDTVKAPVHTRAVVVTDATTDDADNSNNTVEDYFSLNHAPIAKIETVTEVNSGESFTLNGGQGSQGQLSKDSDGSITSYKWNMGDVTVKGGPKISYLYQNPGEYTVMLTVRDNNGAESSTSTKIKVSDSRPDLIVTDVKWTPSDPVEQDTVKITAMIGNNGKGTSTLGFLVGFYIDNQYMGYTRVDNDVAVGENIPVTFVWSAKNGVHVLKVVANDILDNLREIDKSNNSRTVALTTKQVNFADIAVDSINCTTDKTDIDSEAAFGYRATISNKGSAKAERFFVSLYVDGVWTAKQNVNLLEAGKKTELTFITKPTAGSHTITVKADDPAPVLVEMITDNNRLNISTQKFNVISPTLQLAPVTWLPQETTLTEGTSLTFETKLKNASSINITHEFNVDFNVDGQLVKSIAIERLGAGETVDVWARWQAQPGQHKVKITADGKNTVTDNNSVIEADIPALKIIYPDLNISDVQWSPLVFKYGQSNTFIARISNQSVTSIFKRFNIGLYVDGKQVAGKTVEGLRGHSTAIVDLTWSPSTIGNHTVKITADNFNEIKQEPLKENEIRTWERSFNVTDSLVLEAHPNEKDQEEDFTAVLYCSSSKYIPLTVSARRASDLQKLLGPESGINASYTLQAGTNVVSAGLIGFDPSTRIFKGQIPITTLKTGQYILTIEAGDGAEKSSFTSNIMIIQDTVANVESDKETYQIGETIHLAGNFTFKDGSPMANEQVVIDLQLEPRLEMPVQMRDKNGNPFEAQWHGEHISYVKTDANGHFEYDFIPSFGEAGKWHVNVFAMQRMLGNGASSTFTVWGMKTLPSSVSLTASKNSQFSKAITIRNAAQAGDLSLTSVNAVLINQTPESKVRATLDTSALKAILAPGESGTVILNFTAPLDCDDTAMFRVNFSSGEGVSDSTDIKLYLRPAVPLPVTDPKGFEAGLHPGDTVTKTVKLTNKGLGKMTDIRLTAPQNVPWIKAANLAKTTLAPGESTSFDVIINPSVQTPLGQYQDRITVTDGKFSAVFTVAAEVSSANKGSLSFMVMDDAGVRVSNAEVYLVGKEPYTQLKDGQTVTYYQNFYGRTDSSGIVNFSDKPLGEYTYTIRARGRNTVTGTSGIMPKTEASVVQVVMENQPVQIDWSVTPTTIQDKYDIKLELTFGANIPKPSFGFVPPWVNIPKQVTDPVVVEATVVNTGLVAITDVTASVKREKSEDVGISIIDGGYLGEIPAHGSVKIKLLIQPGYYNLKSADGKSVLNYIKLHGNFVSFDSDTGLPVDPAEQVEGKIPLYNAGEKTVKVEVKMPGGETVSEEMGLPDEQLGEIDYLIDRGDNNGGQKPGDQKSAYEIVTLKLDQTATLERQAFNARLKVANGYENYSLQNMAVKIVISDMDGNDVTNKNFIIPMGIQGMAALDGSDSLAAGQEMSADWQFIPGEGLGGTDPSGKVYLAKAIISYYVNGHYVETQTQAEKITILPQPQITLHYYVPHTITANQPFRLGVIAENTGDGTAKNLVIDSGQLEITTNQAGLLTKFDIVGTSFGSTAGNTFTLNLGDIAPHSKVSGYWLVKWNMYEEGKDSKALEGEFKSFKASLHHQDYKGVQLNPLINGVTTEIIGKDNLFAKENEPDSALTLIDVGETGLPNYLINLKTGMRLPVYVPQSLNVTKQPEDNDSTLKFDVPSLEQDPDKPEAPRYQVLMLKDPLAKTNIRSVERESYASANTKAALSMSNSWKDYGNIYIVDEIPINTSKPENYKTEQARYYYPSSYTISFNSGTSLKAVEYAQYYWGSDTEQDSDIIEKRKAVYYDIGHYPDEKDETSVRAEVFNKGKSVESGKVIFYAKREGSEKEIKIGEASYSALEPLCSKYLYINWIPEKGGSYKLIARIEENNSTDASAEKTAVINYRPYADAGADFSADVLKQARFDGSRTYDKDGYVQSYIWEFGDGESGYGVCPVHIYQHSGTYKVKLTARDNNNAESTSEMQITINETRPDLRVTDIMLDKDSPTEGEKVTVTGKIYNGGYSSTKAPFIAGFYVDNQYQYYVKVNDEIKPGETKEVPFEWTNIAGNHMLTIIANDFGHPVDEADFDNNQKSRPVDTGIAFFPNLKVTEVKWNGSQDGTFSWNEQVTVSATIENNGLAPAKDFQIAFFADGEFQKGQSVSVLSNKAGENSITVTMNWNAKANGKHKFRFLADGPIPHVVESDKSDNEKEIISPDLRLKYPDLKIDKLSISPDDGTLKAGQPVIISASLINDGYADAARPFKVSFYADDVYLGTEEISCLAKGESKSAAYLWNRPMNGVKVIKAVVDENNDVPEILREVNDIPQAVTTSSSIELFEQTSEISDIPEISHTTGEDNNILSLTLKNALSVELPDLVIESIESTPETAKASYGDTITTVIRLKNNGNGAIGGAFNTVLYVNDKEAGSFQTKVLAPGQTKTGTITWKAQYKPTAPCYILSAYADANSSINIADRKHAKMSVQYKVAGVMQLAVDSLKPVYTLKENPAIAVKVTSTDEQWEPLGTDDGVKATVTLYSGAINNGLPSGQEILTRDMTYELAAGKFKLSLEPNGLTNGTYTVAINVSNGTEQKTEYREIQLINDYVVTAKTSKQTYQTGEPIEVSGIVTEAEGKPISHAEVTVTIVGEQEWQVKAETDETGKYTAVYSMENGFGGAYSLNAAAKVNGADKKSEPKVFYIEGLYAAMTKHAEIAAGYETDIPVTIANVGTLPVTGITIEKTWTDAKGMTVEFPAAVPKKLEAGESISLNIHVAAAEDALPGIRNLQLKLSCSEGYTGIAVTEFNIAAAYPKYSVTVLGATETDDEGNAIKDRITTSVIPGSMVTQVIRVANNGTAPITGLTVTSPQKLPWVYLSLAGTDIIKPMNKGLSIRDDKSHATISVNISPTDYVKTGIYEDEIVIASNAGEYRVPIKVYVGSSNVGTAVIQVLDKESIPVQGVKLELSGPMAAAGVQPAELKTYQGEKADGSTFTFKNIPAGTYTLHAESEGFKTLETSIDIPAVIDLTPQKVYMEILPYSFTWKMNTELNLQEPDSNSIGDYEGAVMDAEQPVKTSKPTIVTNFPGSELYFADAMRNMHHYISIMNTSDNADISDVHAELSNLDKRFPEGAIKIEYGDISTSGSALYMGDLKANEVKDLTVGIDHTKFYNYIEFKPTKNENEYTFVLPPEVTQGMFDNWKNYINYFDTVFRITSYNAVTRTYTIQLVADKDGKYELPDDRIPKLYGNHYYMDYEINFTGTITNDEGKKETITRKIPGRVQYHTEDSFMIDADPKYDDNIQVTASFKAARSKNWENKQWWHFSQDFLEKTSSYKEEPENKESSDSSFGFKQDILASDEIKTLNFSLKNPSKYKFIDDARFEVIVTDMPLDENNNLEPGASNLTSSFCIDSNYSINEDNVITIDSIAPDEKKNISLKLQINPAYEDEDSYGTRYVYTKYDFYIDGSRYEGITMAEKFSVEKRPKLFISYELKPSGSYYELVAKVTNTKDGGTAHNVTLGQPYIPGCIPTIFGTRLDSEGGWNTNDNQLKFGDIPPNTTVEGRYRIMGNGLDELAKLPGLPVYSEIAENIKVTPLAMQEVTDSSAYNQILNELDKLKENVNGVINKTGTDVSVATVDTLKYIDQLDFAVKTTEVIDNIYSTVCWINLMKGWVALAKFTASKAAAKFACKNPATNPTAIKGLSKDIEDLIKVSGKNSKVLNEASGRIFKPTFIPGDIDNTFTSLMKGLKVEDDAVRSILNKSISEMDSVSIGLKNELDTLRRLSEGVNNAETRKLIKESITKIKGMETQLDSLNKISWNGNKMTLREFMTSVSTNKLIKNGPLSAKKFGDKLSGYFYNLNKAISGENSKIGILEFSKKLYENKNAEKVIRILFPDSLRVQTYSVIENEVQKVFADPTNIEKMKEILGGLISWRTVTDTFLGTNYLREIVGNIYKDKISSNIPQFFKKTLEVHQELKWKINSKDVLMSVFIKNLDSLSDGKFKYPDGKSREDYIKSVEAKLDKYTSKYDREVILLNELFNNLEFKSFDTENSSGNQADKTLLSEIYNFLDKFGLTEEQQKGNDKKSDEAKKAKEDFDEQLNEILGSWTTNSSSIYQLTNLSGQKIEVVKDIIKNYIQNNQEAPAYYPLEPLLTYLKNLNKNVGSIWHNGKQEPLEVTGSYKKLMAYDGKVSGDIDSSEIDLTDLYRPLIGVNSSLAQGYGAIADRWVLNVQKSIVAGYNIVSPFLNMSFGASIFWGIATETWNNCLGIVEEGIDGEDQQFMNNSLRFLASSYAAATGMYNKEVYISESVSNLFTAVDKWRKIDPPVDIDVKSFSVRDVVTSKEDQTGSGEAVLVITSNHTGTIAVSPSLGIYCNGEQVGIPETNTVSINPGETVTIKIPFIVPRSTLVDTAGFDAVAILNVAEPETMTISSAVGPYTAHFYAGTDAQLDAYRGLYTIRQPLGGTLAAGEQEEIIYNTNGNTREARLFLSANPDSKIKLEVYDSKGNRVAGNNEADNDKANAVSSIINRNDYIRIPDFVKGPYKLVAGLPEGSDSEEYSVQLQEIPEIGAVPDFSLPHKLSSTSNKFRIEIGVFESGRQKGIEKAELKIKDFIGQNGQVITGSAISLKDKNGESIPGNILPGSGLKAYAGFNLPDDIANGIYNGNVVISVSGSDLNPDMCRQTGIITTTGAALEWVEEPLEGTEHETKGWKKYSITIPVSLLIDTTKPVKPTIENVIVPADEKTSSVTISGTADKNSAVMVYVNNIFNQMIRPEQNGTYKTNLSLDAGDQKIYVKAMNQLGAESEPSDTKTVTIGKTDKPIEVIPFEIQLTDAQNTGKEINVKICVKNNYKTKIKGNLLLQLYDSNKKVLVESRQQTVELEPQGKGNFTDTFRNNSGYKGKYYVTAGMVKGENSGIPDSITEISNIHTIDVKGNSSQDPEPEKPDQPEPGKPTNGGQVPPPVMPIENDGTSLASLSFSSGKLSPAFDKDTTEYELLLDKDTQEITVSAQAEDDKSVIAIENIVAKGINSCTLKLMQAQKNITIKVTAKTGLTRTYAIKLAWLTDDIPKKPDDPVNTDNEVIIIDLTMHWAKDSIVRLVKSGILSGYSDKTFRPDNKLTRAEAVVLLAKLFGKKSESDKRIAFNDNKNIPKWAYPYVQTAVDQGWIKGYTDNTFRASSYITRQEFAVMFVKAMNVENKNKRSTGFKDDNKIAAWAKEYVAKAVELSLVSGYADNTFRGQGNITRAEAASMSVKYLDSKK